MEKRKEKSEEKTIKVDGIRDIVVNNETKGIVRVLELLCGLKIIEILVQLFNSLN